MEQGPTEQTIIRQCLQVRRELPAKIRDAPELRFGLELYFGAFFDLSSCRGSGMGEGPIPWSAIADYCNAHGFEGDQIDDTFYLVRAMDNAYLGHHEKSLKKKIKSGKS